jgi:hypothetical protein
MGELIHNTSIHARTHNKEGFVGCEAPTMKPMLYGTFGSPV